MAVEPTYVADVLEKFGESRPGLSEPVRLDGMGQLVMRQYFELSRMKMVGGILLHVGHSTVAEDLEQIKARTGGVYGPYFGSDYQYFPNGVGLWQVDQPVEAVSAS